MSVTVWCWGAHEGDTHKEHRKATTQHTFTDEQAVRMLEWMSAEDWEDGPRCLWELMEELMSTGSPEGNPLFDLVNLTVRFPDESVQGRSRIFRKEAKLIVKELFGQETEWDKNMIFRGEEVTRLQDHNGRSIGIAVISMAAGE